MVLAPAVPLIVDTILRLGTPQIQDQSKAWLVYFFFAVVRIVAHVIAAWVGLILLRGKKIQSIFFFELKLISNYLGITKFPPPTNV